MELVSSVQATRPAGSTLVEPDLRNKALARALYKKPKILVLDEATSHLDVWNEQAVNQAIQKIALTRIIVAHRPETIQMAERVIVLHDGQVAQDLGKANPEDKQAA